MIFVVYMKRIVVLKRVVSAVALCVYVGLINSVFLKNILNTTSIYNKLIFIKFNVFCKNIKGFVKQGIMVVVMCIILDLYTAYYLK